MQSGKKVETISTIYPPMVIELSMHGEQRCPKREKQLSEENIVA